MTDGQATCNEVKPCLARNAYLDERVKGLNAGEGADHVDLEHSSEIGNVSAQPSRMHFMHCERIRPML